jgi:hypothetical protein
MKKLILTTVIFLAACTKVVNTPIPTAIDLGVKSTSTAIKGVKQENNVITVEFDVTQGSKYSVQITPFNSFTPVFTEGFTANSSSTVKIYNLSKVLKNDYNLIFIDVSGKEVRYPIIIK